MRRNLSVAGAALLLSALGQAGEVKVQRSPDAVTADLGNGAVLGFALQDGCLLGLRTAQVAGVPLKSDRTAVRPYLLQEWVEKPLAFEFLRLVDVTTDGARLELKVELLATDEEEARRAFFVYGAEGTPGAGQPHLDNFRFAHTQLSALLCNLEAQKARLAKAGVAKPAGTLRWIFEPVTLNVAGWPYRGWKHHYEFELAGGAKLNCLRELGTWETQGQAAGNTLVNLRYRGLGGIAAKLEPLDGAKPAPGAPAPIRNSFTTTEILPGWADKPPAVSPAVPGPQDIASRAEGMKYRASAWIAQLQRGGGVHWADFQYRPGAALATWYEKMAAIKSLTECWPGDTEVSHYDGLYFPLTDKAATTAKYVVALVPPEPLPEHEWHTRWQELDQYLREWLCQDLDMKLFDPLPSVGFNWDTGWEGSIKGLAARAEALQKAGVKRVLLHHPGWFNGRGLRQKESDFPIPLDARGQPDTGGDCTIHDYVPQSEKVRLAWLDATQKLNAADIQYWVWITGMVKDNGPVVSKIGADKFCRNRPGDTVSCGYPPKLFGISLREPEIRKWWNERMDAAVADLGVQGFWADSWQNMYMSQMNYQQPDGAPQVREWWEWVAAMSRKGVGFMSESTAFPGLSCSIEVGGNPRDFEGMWWVLPYSTRWYRGEDVPGKGTAQADRLFFRSMANKGPIAPGGGNVSQIPSYAQMSSQYMFVLPFMRRPYQLPDDGGVLWLSNSNDNSGVLYSFRDLKLPAGVSGSFTNHEGPDVQALSMQETYLVSAPDLLRSFGLRRGPEKDPRLGVKYVAPEAYKKKW